MTDLTLSPYRGPQDYHRVREMLRENVLAARELAILDWCRFITQANAQTLPQLRLWHDADTGGRLRLVAFVWPDFGGSEIITRADCRDAFEPILDWEEAHVGFDKAVDGIPPDKRGARAPTKRHGKLI